MLRRDLWDEGFRFSEEFRIGEDVVLWLRIAARHGVLGLDEALTIVRASPVSTAYDRAKQSMGVANILTAVRSTPELACYENEVERLAALASSLRADPDCGIRGIADRIPTQAGQRSDDCGQPMRAG